MTVEWALIIVLVLALFAVLGFFFTRKSPIEAPAQNAMSPEELRSQIELLVRSATGEAFQSSSKTLIDLAKSELKQTQDLSKQEVQDLIKPLAESLQTYRKEMNDLESLRNRDMGSLDKLLKTVLETNQQLKKETGQLVSALKSPTVRGKWGEVQLKRIVELAGMSQHCDFSEQTSVSGTSIGDDSKYRPDMVIHLPNGRDIVVDAKAVLSGYLEAEELQDETLRKQALIRHAQSLKTRISDLSRKAYWEQFKSTPEFVVLFIPAEAFFSAAAIESPDLVEFGFESRVIIATPTTLMALLRAVALGWRQEQLAENSRRIAEQAGKLYQGLGVWVGHLEQMGSALEKTTKSYNAAIGSLERSVLPPARRLKEMGASSKDEIGEVKQIEIALRDTSALTAKTEI